MPNNRPSNEEEVFKKKLNKFCFFLIYLKLISAIRAFF